MRLLAARHPCNHALVQELALRAALTSTLTSTPAVGDVDSAGNNLYQAAAAVAHSPLAVEEALAYAPGSVPGRPLRRLGPLPKAILHRRCMAQLYEQRCPPAPPPPTQPQPTSDAGRTPHRLPVTAPGRLIALYGPYVALPALPDYMHDLMTYTEAAHHLATLQSLLEPLGFMVSMDGSTRRGCPLGAAAEFLVTLQREAEEALGESGTDLEWGGKDSSARDGERRRSAFTAATAVASAETLGSLKTVPCTAADVVGPPVGLPPRTAHRCRRALQHLHRFGYLVATTGQPGGEAGSPRGVRGSARYDPDSPASPPPFHVTERAVLARLRLHRVWLRFVPHEAYLARRLLNTGPPAFATHATLRALERGLELNRNGLFVRTHARDSSPAGGPLVHVSQDSEQERPLEYRRVVLNSEMELFAAIGLPYVDPIGRGVYCQSQGITIASA